MRQILKTKLHSNLLNVRSSLVSFKAELLAVICPIIELVSTKTMESVRIFFKTLDLTLK